MKYYQLACLLSVSVLGASIHAAGPEPILLWSNGAPGAVGEEDVDRPQVWIYAATEDPTGAMVVICPGGGYGALATDHEGHQVAKWFNRMGVSAIVLKYRLGPRYNHPAPLQDAQRAIRYVRANAKELNIDPNRVGIIGFSAGGHLASTVSTHFDKGDNASQDPIAQQSSRPDFSILCYPVISLNSDFSHKGSARNLLGDNPDPMLLASLSNETQVTQDTPPTFIFHTYEDPGVPVMNAIVYYQALIKHGVPAELHIYQKGPHGVGLAPGSAVLSTWTERLADWLKTNDLLSPAKKPAAVSGTIQHNGKPLRWGSITFVPKIPHGAEAFAMVSHGKYALKGAGLPNIGEYSLKIINLGDVVPYPTLEDAVDLQPGGVFSSNVVLGDNTFDLNIEHD